MQFVIFVEATNSFACIVLGWTIEYVARMIILLHSLMYCLMRRLHVKQVAQLSQTNPRDALHHGKQQNFKTVT